jgi:hypothetical protein
MSSSATVDLSESPQKLQEPDPDEAELHMVRFLYIGSGSDFLPLIRLAVKAGTRRKRTESGRWLKTTHADASANRGDEHAQ